MFNWLASIIMITRSIWSLEKSCSTHAVVHLDQWLFPLEKPNNLISSCPIDFSKPFDRIDDNILKDKLRLLNVRLVLLNWCAKFLQDIQQRIKVGSCTSTWSRIKPGIPQGTKLRPVFFLVMVNYLSTELPMRNYVDDFTVSEVVITKEMDSSNIICTNLTPTYDNCKNNLIVFDTN